MGRQLIPTGEVTKPRVKIDKIPQDTVDDVEDALKYCADHEDKISIKFATQDEGDMFLKEARAYARDREPRVVVTGNSLKSGLVKFRVELYDSATDSDGETTPAA